MRFARLFTISGILACGLFFIGCDGDEGPVGPAGPAGDGYDYTYAGIVTTADGVASADNLVLLKALDPDGAPVTNINTVATEDGGVFTIGSTIDATALPLGLEAIAGGARLRAFLVNTDGQDISPVTEGVVDLVTMVTGSPAGRSMDDYSAADINALVAAADAALTSAGTDLDDPDAVRAQLLTDIGGQLADFSGGTYTIGATLAPVSVDPADVVTSVDAFYVELTDGGGELWDLAGDGSVSDGTSDSYDDMFDLEIDGESFPTQVAPGSTALIEDGRELVLGPVSLAGLTVTRKIHVPETDSWARFAEILYNEGAADVTVDVLISGNLGSDESTDAVHFSSDGDQNANDGDVWLTMKWDDDPTVGFFFPGAVPTKDQDNLEYVWTSVTVPAGQTVILLHWGFQSYSSMPQVMAAVLAGLEQGMSESMYEGLSIAEGAAAPFVVGEPNVIGEAGSFAPLATVALENTTSSATASASAAPDGSLAVTLRGTSTGDQIHVTASDGTDETITVE